MRYTFFQHVYKMVVIAEETNSLEALRILFQCKKRVVPEDYILVRQDLRDFSKCLFSLSRLTPSASASSSSGRLMVWIPRPETIVYQFDSVQLKKQALALSGEYGIKHTERLSVHCKGPYGKIILKKLKKPSHVQWDEKRLISFIDYDSPDEGLDDDGSEQGSSDSSSVSIFS